MKAFITAALFALIAGPALAADCKNTMESVTAALDANGAAYSLLPPERVQPFVDEVVEPLIGSGDITNVVNVIFAVLGEVAVFGLEFDDGCVTDPIAMPNVSAKPAVFA